ncbi:MAG: bifunctional response regulator/alkaline phosphatase family protein [Bacteroidales bacterium]|jgi:CheY-like chemotaxis protein|nr:bifunctional response regulator/alkaline phosphatase family protein [Bacteroidales bacterium]
MDTATKILWVDDEIDLLKPHILFLQGKGIEVHTVNNGSDALSILENNNFAVVFLDEQMPGLSGLETLAKIKELQPSLPVVMVTKSEEEQIMDEAIGSKISDYLIKPVSPNQLFLAIKKQVEIIRLVEEKASVDYQKEFRQIGTLLSSSLSYREWESVYKKLVKWDLELSANSDENLKQILENQFSEANSLFSRYIEKNYVNFVQQSRKNAEFEMSHTVLQKKVFPLLNKDKIPTFLILIDNLRLDQWRVLQPFFSKLFPNIKEESFMGILPSVTQYARNSMFAGLLPSEIQEQFPQYWVDEDEDEHKNQYEKELLEQNLSRSGHNIEITFNKVLNQSYGIKIADYIPKMLRTPLNVIIYGFVDMLSHASTEIELLREMSKNDSAYRSLIVSWFEYSPLYEILKKLSEKKIRVILTTDHGSIRVANPIRIRGDRETSFNLRYKSGRHLEYDAKDVFTIKNPADAFLPKSNLTSSYIFCRNHDYLVYPNNYSQYVQYYKNTIQHGGISLEELLIPVITMEN